MKKLILALILSLIPVITFSQNKLVERIILSKDSVPEYIEFTDKADINISDANTILKKYLKLTNYNNFTLSKELEDEYGYVHGRYDHFYKGLKVEFSNYILHSKNEHITSMNGRILTIKTEVNVNPSISAKIALNYALSYYNSEQYIWEIPEMEDWIKKEKQDSSATYFPKEQLIIWSNIDNTQYRLAYKFDIYSQKPLFHEYIYIDAHSGKVLDTEPIMINSAVIGTAQTRYSGTVNLTTDSHTGGYSLRDPSRGNGLETYDMNTSTIISTAIDFNDANNNWTAAEWNNSQKDNAALDAHYALQKTYDYFSNIHNRKSYDNNYGRVRCYVHYDYHWNNARWDGGKILLGDGDGYLLDPLTSLDIIAHEFGHGISKSTCQLHYEGFSGALDEGLSDIWAACIESYAAIPGNQIWRMGENVSLSGFPLRYMDVPKLGNLPDTYLGTYWLNPNCGTPSLYNDYCGVHTNMGVINYWFYLLSQGGSNTNDLNNSYAVCGIGIDAAAKIVYRMETAYLTSNSTFFDAKNYSIQAAKDIYGTNSNQVRQTTNAWYAVGVGSSYNTITGPDAVCGSGHTFIVNNVPSGTTVTWTYSSNLYAHYGGSNFVVLASNGDGAGWVRAHLNSTCGQYTIQKDVNVGRPATPESIIGPTELPGGGCAWFEVNSLGATEYVWNYYNFDCPVGPENEREIYLCNDSGAYHFCYKSKSV